MLQKKIILKKNERKKISLEKKSKICDQMKSVVKVACNVQNQVERDLVPIHGRKPENGST